MIRYDKVLRDGLPDWRSAMYYYRRYRKMGLAEMIGLVFVIFTFAQYIVAWAVYAEKKYTAVSLTFVRIFMSISGIYDSNSFRKRFSAPSYGNYRRRIKQM